MPKGVYIRTEKHKEAMKKTTNFKKGVYQGYGFKKGQRPWNKDKKLSKEHCNNLSESHKGYIMPEEQKKKISKALNKGGYISKSGHRVLCIEGEHIAEHRMVWIRHNKMSIPQGFIIHHRDQDKLNNHIDNLLLLPQNLHLKLHWAYEKGEI